MLREPHTPSWPGLSPEVGFTRLRASKLADLGQARGPNAISLRDVRCVPKRDPRVKPAGDGGGWARTRNKSMGSIAMAIFIALLRAVNVGGTGKLPMKELKAACEKVGLRQVTTYIASGNLVFKSDKSAAKVKTAISDLLRQQFGLEKTRTLIRTPDDLVKVIAGNPFKD